MIEKLRDSRGWQLLTITTLILIVPLMADINGRIGVIRRMQQREAQLNRQLDQERQVREELRSQLEQVTDDAYLERWARVDARMTLPGEVAIIPLFPEQFEPVVSAPVNNLPETDAPASISEQWRRLFFDAAPDP
jgi:cell division protein FtsB